MQSNLAASPARPLEVDLASAAGWRARRQQFRSAAAADQLAVLRETSRRIRRDVLATIDHAGIGHIGGDFSVADILVTLFNGVLEIDPTEPRLPGRDRFILSKGHCAASMDS